MDRLDRLLARVATKRTVCERLEQDNPYLEKSCDELLDMLCPDTPGGCTAPEMRTPEWDKFMYAFIHAECMDGLEE